MSGMDRALGLIRLDPILLYPFMPSSTDWKKAPGSFLEEGKNFGETLVKAATQGTDGLGSAGIFSKRSTAPPRSVMNSRRSPAARAPRAATPPRRRAA
jgi:hypothetical protein